MFRLNATDLTLYLLPKRIIRICNNSRGDAPLLPKYAGQVPINPHAKAIVEAAEKSMARLNEARTHGRDSTHPLAIEVTEDGKYFMVRLGTVAAWPPTPDRDYRLEDPIVTFRAEANGEKLSVYLNGGHSDMAYAIYEMPGLERAINDAFNAAPGMIGQGRF